MRQKKHILTPWIKVFATKYTESHPNQELMPKKVKDVIYLLLD